ncbi:MAG: type II secretion system protein [bacterium]|nr:type II secretion system protein [bacterium]
MNFTKSFKRGFTLIELLVVVAIIGILASVVLASLNSARSKGTDAAIRSNLANARAQAELFYDNNANVYTGVCAIATGTINTLVQAASTAAGTGTVVITGAAQTALTANCFSTAGAWAAEVKLKANTTDYACVDSAGASKVITVPLGLNAVVCA